MSRAREFADLAGSADAGGLTGRNFIINGAMQVNQRGDVSASSGGGYFSCDRYSIRQSGSYLASLTFDVTQETTSPPNGFKYYYQLKTLTGDTPSGDEAGSVRYVVEDKDIENFGFGTSDAKSFTLSFWVKASVAGIYSVGFVAGGSDYSYVAEYTISSVNTWEYISISVPAPTSGTWSSSGAGMQIHWNVAGASGGTYDTTAGSWIAADKRYSNNQVNNTATANNTFNFTGVQLEVGDTATPFEHRSYGDELARCKRYFERFERQRPGAGSAGTTSLWAGLARSGASNVQGPMHYVEKRNNPTISVSSAGHLNAVYPISPFNAALSAFGIDGNAGTQSAYINATGSGSPGSDCASFVYIGDAAGYLDIDAEL